MGNSNGSTGKNDFRDVWIDYNLSGTFSRSKAGFIVDITCIDQTNIFLPHFIPVVTSYPAKIPAVPLGLNLDGASDFLASLGLKFTFAPNGIIFPLNFSLRCIFSHALPSSSLSKFNAWLTYSTANGQKNAGSPACKRHVEAVSRMKRFGSNMSYLVIIAYLDNIA